MAAPRILRFILAAAFLLTSTAVSRGATKITIEPWGEAVAQTYDPQHPPEDLPADRGGHADADARPWIQWAGASLNGKWDRAARTLVLTDVGEITLSGHTTIRLPEHVADKLRDHEFGHDALNANEYFRSARVLAAEAVRGLAGSHFAGDGDDDEACRRDAWAKAEAERDRRMSEATAKITERMDELADLFDEATTHGRSRLVDTKRGIEIAIQKRDHPPATRPASRPSNRPATAPAK